MCVKPRLWPEVPAGTARVARRAFRTGALAIRVRDEAARARGITLLVPLRAGSSPQSRSGGYTADMFAIGWENKQVTCPQGQVSGSWSPSRTRGKPAIYVQFARGTCHPCPARAQCTTATRNGRSLGLHLRHIHEAITAARAEQASQAWRHRTRSGPASKAPSPRPPTSPASAAPATSACRKPAWNTTPQPPPST